MFLFLALSCLISSVSGGIKLVMHSATQSYYFRFSVQKADASACGDSIANVYIYANNNWRAKSNYYNADNSYDFNYFGIKFDDMEPISIQFEMSSGRTINLWGIITDNSPGKTFTSSKGICDGSSPTKPTSKPTAKPIAPTKPTTPYPTGSSVCIAPGNMKWRSYNNQIYLNGNRFNMKGLSWFGFETGNYGLYGLDRHNVNWYLNWMVDNGFNAIRLPFSGDFMRGNGNLEKYRQIVEAAGKKGLLVMPDYHSDNAGSWTDGLNTINKNNAKNLWKKIANALKNEYNVLAADIFNEPHDVSNGQWGEWVTFCEDAAEAIWSTGVNWLVAVEGTNWQCDVISCAWGENLEGVRKTGETFNRNTYGANRFIWSPHVYGADVTGNGAYSEAAWKSHWGYLVDGSYKSNKAASVIGEFGTKYTGSMQNWLKSLITYLIKIDQRNTFFWCLNPNSGDTGGLLKDDWTTPESGKLTQLKRLQPNPSKITLNNGKVCVSNLGASAAFIAESEATDGALDWTSWFAIIISSLIFIGCMIGLVICIKRRRNKKVKVSFQETGNEDAGDTPVGDTPNHDDKTGGYDMSPISTVTPDGDNDQEIEVELNVNRDDDDQDDDEEDVLQQTKTNRSED